MLIWNKRRRLQLKKQLDPVRGKHPPIVENQQSSLTDPSAKKHEMLFVHSFISSYFIIHHFPFPPQREGVFAFVSSRHFFLNHVQ
ncbi:MAG: hypothetical protein ACE3JN_11515 [Ectobacillus sp.]